MKRVALSTLAQQLPEYLREAAGEQLVITRNGRPIGVLIGFASEDDWFDYRIAEDPRFAQRVARARQNIRRGKGRRLEQVPP